VAKILVADDNSNVQKTVALALANLGVEVVSVNNGEAAVRKLSDFSPDLVLADIFMPVRNGYEVCEYVKKDSRFSRVPVVLLVGAFDPFDEREAQRVGADGILKKPFVPPDPLITMVKTLLDRTLGERLVAVSASQPPAAAQTKTGTGAIAEMHFPEAESSEESSNQGFPPPAERIEFGEGERPVAFGMLLETPAQEAAPSKTAVIEPGEDEQVVTSSRDATLGDPIFWRNDSPETEPVEPSKEVPVELEMSSWKPDEDSLSPRDEAVLLQPIEPLELVRDEQDEISPSVVDSKSILLDAAAQSTLNVEPDQAKDLAANPIEWMATAPLEQSSETSEAAPEWGASVPDADDTADLTIENAKASEHPGVPVQVPAQIPAQILTEASTPLPAQVSKSPDTTPPETTVDDKTSPSPMPTLSATSVPKLQSKQSTEDTARSIPKRDWADLTESLEASASELVTRQVTSAASLAEQVPLGASGNSQPVRENPSPAHDAPPDAALVETVVQRVLEKMRPQVVDIITREFLRPIVQALVHREIEKL
jgi:CheY-like chemotaxis protein